MDPTKIKSGSREARSLETTYAELRDGDILVDKSGGRWHVSGVDLLIYAPAHVVAFWLGDVRTKVRQHKMTKPVGDPVTVERIPTHADDVKTLLDDFDVDRNAVASLPGVASPEEDARRAALLSKTFDEQRIAEGAAHDAAVTAVEQGMPGSSVDVDVTAEQVDAARQATEDEPVEVALFESMTDLEQRSHLFVLHGIFCEDIEDRRTRAETHVAAHREKVAGRLRSLSRPHVHTEKVTA